MNNAMEETAYDAFRYSLISELVFGILGNILVIISIARQKQLLKKNYYFLVLHLAVCDLGASVFLLLSRIFYHLNVTRYSGFNIACLFHLLHYSFYLSGLAMMLMISMLRYRATVHPLKPAISQGKLINFGYVVYVTSLTTGLGLNVPSCVNVKLNYSIYTKFMSGFDFFLYLVPTIFMIVCYCKIGRALVKQNNLFYRSFFDCCWNSFSKSTDLWNTRQKNVQISKTMQQEKANSRRTDYTGSLKNES